MKKHTPACETPISLWIVALAFVLQAAIAWALLPPHPGPTGWTATTHSQQR